jgi:FAD/FMN-containing dehydrogenase
MVTGPSELVKPGEGNWDSARAAWNLAIDQRPAMVARPGGADEVAAVVKFARENDLRVAVQAEGHGAGALAGVGEDTLLLKTGRMIGTEVDAENRRARVAAAAKWRDVDALASPRGLAALAGSSAEVGVVGYTLGGGQGWLARKHGLACNSVLAAEVVTADGELVRADLEHEPDLFWALRGGGGNFGVVTALEFELYPASDLYPGLFAWPWDLPTRTDHAVMAERRFAGTYNDDIRRTCTSTGIGNLGGSTGPQAIWATAHKCPESRDREFFRPIGNFGAWGRVGRA